MKSKTLLLIVAANLAVFILLAITLPQLMISPGNPIDAHADLASDCFACHSPFFGSTPEKCITCHQVADIGLKTTTGEPIEKEKKNVAFHQSLIEDDCVACHSEHKGVQPFRPIGQFSHQLLEQSVQTQCDSCHGNPGDSLHRKITGNCNTCHTQDRWVPATFEHDEYFRFDRNHETECETCHIDDNYTAYTCYGCHEHSRSKIREEHREEGIFDYENCVECHRSGDEEEAEYLWRSRRYPSGDQRSRYRSREYEYEEYREHNDD
ncbi:MAG: class III cytochrome C family protein [Candidatus Thiodiazotropha lotti]|nr:class III cytochrome C family protein [Candidatus Thiodiazotropha lotti]MCG8002764.1 class III cytochrome C family protein [Candidatus Thiodiazotropha lotti]MCG8007110.1 class III cytochrome C family protein [Candidatus Thiodiazotropha lotti]MCW4186384.1 class III cytochrome C family protein [Candidatus Thiodiazotropha lotti]MCW4194691.1 class III cytochrome C family protein [Candidatus Thiodiazotropha lotti]